MAAVSSAAWFRSTALLGNTIYKSYSARFPLVLASSKAVPNLSAGNGLRTYSSTASSTDDAKRAAAPSILIAGTTNKETTGRAQKIVKAMKAYLEKVVQHTEFMKKQNEEFEVGRRHLARMMGADPNNFSSEDIAQAIRYLLPSGLYDKKARPLLNFPQEIFPTPKAAQFDASGRPTHPFFYTGKPYFYQVIFDVSDKLELLNSLEDEMLRRGIRIPPQDSKIELGGSTWVTIQGLEDIVLEKLTETDYQYFLTAMTRLCEHPYSNHVKDFVMKFRKPVHQSAASLVVPELKYEDGRAYVETEGRRKTARASVRVWSNGTGKVEINGQDITYFDAIQDREQIMFPLEFTDMLGKVDVVATVSGGGFSGQSGAIRHGLSLALTALLSKDWLEKMRLAGLLSGDRRTRERKKPGQKGARAKYTWKKR